MSWGCARCGGPKRARSARKNAPAGYCGTCKEPICEKHLLWRNDEWICVKCERIQAI